MYFASSKQKCELQVAFCELRPAFYELKIYRNIEINIEILHLTIYLEKKKKKEFDQNTK